MQARAPAFTGSPSATDLSDVGHAEWELTVKVRSGVFLALLFLCGGTAVHAQNDTPPASPAPEAANDLYRIGPGDQLQIFVWRNPELSTTVPVRPDGKLSTPLIENMEASGKTPSQLARDMEAVLGEYVRSPKVNVIVVQAVSTFSQVRVVGQVLKPQALPYRDGMTVIDAVLGSGGLTPYASGNRAKIVRSEGGKSREIRVKLDKLLNGGDMTQNMALRPGDVLVIPQTMF
jgi:polysaccharide biosynthesis/export protein